MYDIATVRIILKGLVSEPGATLAGGFRRLRHLLCPPPWLPRLREATRQAPFLLQIETTNVCNARCTFCAYPGMKRAKGVMSPELFEKVVREYASVGGGAVSLTPVVGDALLDPRLAERLQVLARYREITQVTLTTNAIALSRYSDQELHGLLSALTCLQVSVGGLDSETYRLMYGVDRFDEVLAGMERLVRLRGDMAHGAALSFAFRTNDPGFEKKHREVLERFTSRGVFVSHIWSYANYAGAVSEDPGRGLMVLGNKKNKPHTCLFPRLHSAVCWDGRVTGCACSDYEGSELTIGDVASEALGGILCGPKRTGLLDSFPSRKLAGTCRECSSYLPDTDLVRPFFAESGPHRPLPLEFFRQMMT